MDEFHFPSVIPQSGIVPVVTHLQIAESLSTTTANVKRKIIQMMKKIPEFELDLISFNSERSSNKPGPDQIVYALNQKWARFLVARYENDKGMKYLRALIGLEMDVLPELLARIQRLNAELNLAKAQLAENGTKRLKGPKQALISFYQNDLWGNPTLSHRAWVSEETASQWKVLEGKAQNARAAARGLLNKAHELEDEMNSGRCN